MWPQLVRNEKTISAADLAGRFAGTVLASLLLLLALGGMARRGRKGRNRQECRTGVAA